MIDIKLIREEQGGDPELVRESQRRRDPSNKRGAVALVDEVIALDKIWRDARYHLDNTNGEFNKLNKQIAQSKKRNESTDELVTKSKELDSKIKQLQREEADAEEACMQKLQQIGNLVHESVPVSDDESDNVTVSKSESRPPEEGPGKGKALMSHVDLVQLLDICDTEKGGEVAGTRGYYLKGMGTLLNQALVSYATGFLARKGYEPVQTPFFLQKHCMKECAQLSDFDEQLYRVSGEGEDKYLIATSEQSLCALLRGTWTNPATLPRRICGTSTCFRKEVGSHGRDTLGIFRVHQFEKVEQFAECSPENDASWDMLEEMLENSKEFYESLNIPHRVVNIVSGELNDAAAKKYDLEAHFPASDAYRELVSCSNCTDYQSRRLGIRFGQANRTIDHRKSFSHLLNATLTATERTICCVLENYQTPEGVVVPHALRPFMHGVYFLPFRRRFNSKGRPEDLPLQPKFNLGAKGEGKDEKAAQLVLSGDPNDAVRRILNLVGTQSVAMASDTKPKGHIDAQRTRMEIESETIRSKAAMLRFIAKEAGRYYPVDKPEEMAKVESILEKLERGHKGGEIVRGCLLNQPGQFLAGKVASIADLYAEEVVIDEKRNGSFDGDEALNDWLSRLNKLK